MLSVHSVLQHLWAPKKIVMAASILLVATWTMADSIAAEISEELLATYKPAQYTAPNGEKIPNVKHNSWTQTYARDDVYEWLFSQKKQ